MKKYAWAFVAVVLLVVAGTLVTSSGLMSTADLSHRLIGVAMLLIGIVVVVSQVKKLRGKTKGNGKAE